MLDKLLSAGEIDIANSARFALGIRHVAFRRRLRGVVVFQQEMRSESVAPGCGCGPRVVIRANRADDDLVVGHPSELVFVSRGRHFVRILEVKRNILEVVFHLRMTNAAEEVFGVNFAIAVSSLVVGHGQGVNLNHVLPNLPLFAGQFRANAALKPASVPPTRRISVVQNPAINRRRFGRFRFRFRSASDLFLVFRQGQLVHVLHVRVNVGTAELHLGLAELALELFGHDLRGTELPHVIVVVEVVRGGGVSAELPAVAGRPLAKAALVLTAIDRRNE